MEKNIDELIKYYEEKKSTHPNIATLWQAYLTTEKYKIEKLLNNGFQVLQNLDETGDITLPTLITVYSLFTDINNIT